MKFKSRAEIRRTFIERLPKSQRLVAVMDPVLSRIIDGFVDQLVDLGEEHDRQMAALRAEMDAAAAVAIATMEAKVAAVKREMDDKMKELEALRGSGEDTNVMRLR